MHSKYKMKNLLW